MPHQERKPTFSPASSWFTGSPRPGKSAQLSALAARLGQSSGGDNQNDASFSFPPNAIFQERERLKSEFKLLFTRSQYFHKIILLGKGMDYRDPRWQNVALWGLWDGRDRKETKP